MTGHLATLGAALAAAVALTACTSSNGHAAPSTPSAHTSSAVQATMGELTISGGYIPQPASPGVAAAYLTVTNHGPRPDTIRTVMTDVTAKVMPMTESDSGGVGSMTDLGPVTVPAHGSMSFTPGHAHLMLENPQRILKQGDRVRMTITFAQSGTVTLTLPVVGLTGPSSAPTSSMSMSSTG
ncbi:MAG TPA: copper chaperone PCu(A)C [Streptosporangiaceae bacterium]|jgi:copper(I)-binding protein